MTLGVVGGALAVWLAAAATSTNPPAVAVTEVPTTVVDRSGAELAAEIARLRERLHPTAAPTQARNLFRYQPRSGARLDAIDDLASAASPTLLDSAVKAPGAPLKLVGLAEDAGDDGPVRTAILSGFGDIFLARTGDVVAERYRVAAISPESVDLIDINTSTPLQIPVK